MFKKLHENARAYAAKPLILTLIKIKTELIYWPYRIFIMSLSNHDPDVFMCDERFFFVFQKI